MSERTLTRAAFEARLSEAQPGDKIVYHVGFLSRDRKYGQNFAAVENTALAACEAWDAQRVHLIAKRVMPEIYEYTAIVKGDAHVRQPGP